MSKKKYLQIFNYLKEFSKLRSKPVRDIELNENQYPEIFWLDDIPDHPLFENVIRSDFDINNDFWLKFSKPDEPEKPEFPKVNRVIEKWIESSSLLDDKDVPILKEKIQEGEEVLYINDFPEIKKDFERYINNYWLDDLIKYKGLIEGYEKEMVSFLKLHEPYKKMFRIFNKSQQFGEEYELVIGVGVINIKNPRILRHILIQRVDIEFKCSPKSSNIIVSPDIGFVPKLETDSIIDLNEIFEIQNIVDAEKEVEKYIKDDGILSLFGDSNVENLIQIFSGRISPDCKYENSFLKPRERSENPKISFSPALILRKRNTRSFTSLYERIISNIEESPENIKIPNLDDLICENQIIDQNEIEEKENRVGKIEEILFPKEYNDEQLEIIKKSSRNNKVLVQGPPGTGKSHTIANIICHLLANGKRILVTAYTKRALEVLKDKLPPEFKNLTVNLLSGDSSSIKDLQSSVNSINNELSKANINEYREMVEKYRKELEEIKENIAFNKNEVLKIKEKTTRKVDINFNYSGTLMKIAETLEADEEKHSWYKDSYDNVENDEEIKNLKEYIELLPKFSHKDLTIYSKSFPDIDKLPTKEDIKEFKKTDEKFRALKVKTPRNEIKCSDYCELKELLIQVQNIIDETESIRLESKNNLIEELIKNGNKEWKEKISESEILIESIESYDLKKIDMNIEIAYPKGKSLKQLKNDGIILLKYINDGNSLSGISFNIKKPFLKREIKERLYFIEQIFLNGNQLYGEREIKIVVKDIILKQKIIELSQLFNIRNNDENSYYKKLSFFKNIESETKHVLENIERFNNIENKIHGISSIKSVSFDKSTAELITDVNTSICLKKREAFKVVVDDAIRYLNSDSTHSIKTKIEASLNDLDYRNYEEYLIETENLISEKERYGIFFNLEKNLKLIFPMLLDDIKIEKFNSEEIPKLIDAIYFINAKKELEKLLDFNYEEKLRAEIQDLEKREKRTVSKLAAKKAWMKTIERLKNNRSVRSHLEAWVLAVRKIGKTGKGKRAIKFRKYAQEEMEHCKNSVPCWIMPLYKVAETIVPEKEIYDYVIIDEASQLGPDATFLLYISKKIIIVGDDKQTSPEYIGVNSEIMTPHIKKYLEGIPKNNFYGTEFSFFDHAKLFCDGMIVLREHFRCMPEIIEFSNKYFYAPYGNELYPLRQYKENRLEPIKTFYCQNGHVEGKGSNIINRPEAEAISEVFGGLIKEEKYRGKTFGVITLQGNQQARLIEDLLIKNIGEKEFHERKIVCGNSASFQGDERDVMILSLVTAHNHKRSALTRAEDERRFNVAVSRAKDQIWLFHSVQIEDLSNSDDLRYKLLNHFKNYKVNRLILKEKIERTLGNQPHPFDSWFEVDVYNDIVGKGFSVIPQYNVSKGRYLIDLVVILPDGVKLAVECDGDYWHGPEQYEKDSMRQKDLERSGWTFFRVRGAEYHFNRIRALEPLWRMIDKIQNRIIKEEKYIKVKNKIEEGSKKFIKEISENILKKEEDLSHVKEPHKSYNKDV